MRKSSKAPKVSRFALYRCTTPDGSEDWFVVAASAREARRFHEDAEGYDRGDALAERIRPLPRDLVVGAGWKDGPRGEIHHSAHWPSDELLVSCGAEIANQSRDDLRTAMAVVCKDVRFGARVFRSGDIVAKVVRELGGAERPRLSLFKGGRQ